jgi:hypothetical protein
MMKKKEKKEKKKKKKKRKKSDSYRHNLATQLLIRGRKERSWVFQAK